MAIIDIVIDGITASDERLTINDQIFSLFFIEECEAFGFTEYAVWDNGDERSFGLLGPDSPREMVITIPKSELAYMNGTKTGAQAVCIDFIATMLDRGRYWTGKDRIHELTRGKWDFDSWWERYQIRRDLEGGTYSFVNKISGED